MSAPAVGPGEDDTVKEAVEQTSLLLHGEGRPGTKKVTVCEFVGQAALLAELGEDLAGLIECPLARLDPLDELLLSKQGQQLGFGDEEVEFVLGLGDRTGSGLERDRNSRAKRPR